MNLSRWLPLLFALFAALPVQAHDLHYTAASGQATVIRLFYVDNTPFTFEGYEIYRDGETLPYQVGRTDGQGRIAFLPDRAGAWRVKALSEDGHGLEFKLTTDAAAALSDLEKPLFERYSRIAVGVAVILGLFGALALFLKPRPAR